MSVNKKYGIVAIILIVIVIVVSLLAYVEWRNQWFILIPTVIVAVTAFLADFRQAFEEEKKQQEAAEMNMYLIAPFQTISAPPVPALFIGRDDDLKLIKERLVSPINGEYSLQVLTAIKGLPGVGKTTVAAAIAHNAEITTKFPDGVLWISLGQKPDIFSKLTIWGHALGDYDVSKLKSLEELHYYLQGILRKKQVLLVIDDVWDARDAVPFEIGGKNCATLITTRVESVANSLAPTERDIYKLKVLTDEFAIELLSKLAPNVFRNNPDECIDLVKKLEGLPLALQVAGRLLNAEEKNGFGVKDLIKELKNGVKLLQAKAPADMIDLLNETTPTITALLQKSLNCLDNRTKKRFAYLGVFAPKPATFDIEILKKIWNTSKPEHTIKILVDRGLIEYAQETGKYQIHFLLVTLAKSLLF